MMRYVLEDEKTLAEPACELESMGLRNASGTVDRFLYLGWLKSSKDQKKRAKV
jgi:hypothetical protein